MKHKNEIFFDLFQYKIINTQFYFFIVHSIFYNSRGVKWKCIYRFPRKSGTDIAWRVSGIQPFRLWR